MKDKLNHPATVLLLVVAFLTLAAIAALRYNDNQAGSERVKQGALYRLGDACWSASERFFSFLMVEPEKKIVDDSADGVGSDGWQRKYVSFQKEQDGWQLVLKSSEGVIRSVSLKNIFKRSSFPE